MTIRAAFTDAGLRLKHVGLRLGKKGGKQLVATGFHADGTPFAFASAEFNDDPVNRARLAAADLIRAHTGWPQPDDPSTQRKDPMSKMGTIAGRMAELKGRLERRSEQVIRRMDGVAVRSEEAFERTEAIIEEAEKEVAEIEQVAATLTNGGPATEDK